MDDPIPLPSTPKTAKLLMGERIRRARLEKGWSLDQFAKALGLSKVSVWQWEQGSARPRTSRLTQVAQVLGISLRELLPGESQETDATSVVRDCQMRLGRYFGVELEAVQITISIGGNEVPSPNLPPR
jgi:transcriptional regulator with XRE-family HTH domain